jgi:DNA-binding NarL/FixJ family response regulator
MVYGVNYVILYFLLSIHTQNINFVYNDIYLRSTMGKKLKILIAEDQTIVREGLRSLLSDSDDLEVVGLAEDGIEAISSVGKYQPDLILLDLSMPKLDGISVISEIKKQFPEVKILVLTFHKSDEYILTAFNMGVDGYCLKTDSHSELLIAIKKVFENKTYFSPGISDKVLVGYLEGSKKLKSETDWESLTQREREVLKLVGEGHKSAEIADYLSISPKTVDKHRSNIMNKLDLHSASALTAYAVKKGLVTE